MHFSLTAIALAAVSIVSGAELDTRDLTCLAGRRFTTVNDIIQL